MSNNRYAQPNARLDDVDPYDGGVQALNLFSAAGRIGRVRLIAWQVGAYLVFVLVSGVLGAALRGSAVSLLVGLPLLVLYMMWNIQRLHDSDMSGWFVLLQFVPVVNLAMIYLLWIKPGTPGANRYGLPPPPNSKGNIVLAWLMPLFIAFIVGILAAVGLPAYQDYMKRAHRAELQRAQQDGQDAPGRQDAPPASQRN